MTEIIGVRFKKVGKIYYFDPMGQTVPMGTNVIVETSRGVECGETVIPNREIDDSQINQPLKKLIRIANEEDLEVLRSNERLEKEAFSICEQKIRKHQLAMKLVAVEYTFDHSKILFYFSADGRVDFRDLVKDLASVFRTRIELRQIGVRDAAKMVGGLGICGCPLCCSTFLDDFQPVSINMAKDQGLSLNPTKISGTCGRLMCCLKYENEAYQELIRTSPTAESLVDTPKGKGTVLDVSLLKGCCRVRLQANPDSPEVFSCADCKILRRGKGSQNQNPGGDPADKADKAERPEKPEKAERPEKAEKPERPERAEKPERPERTERSERSARSERPERPERPARPDKPQRTDRPEKPQKADRPDRNERPQKADRPEKPQKAERPDKPPRADRPERKPSNKPKN